MRIFFDTEFIEDGRTIQLISIGLIREDGATYYAESSEVDLELASPWVQDNVIPHLKGGEARKLRSEIAAEIVDFVGDKPEFWAYYADYDWVVLCQLYGRMIDLPEGWPMYCRDLKQLADDRAADLSVLVQAGPEHHALADATWNLQAYEFLTEEESDEVEEVDLGNCPYYARGMGLPGHDPDATCSYGCSQEPACVTGEPFEGWPSRRGE